jgi:hypothetical protein
MSIKCDKHLGVAALSKLPAYLVRPVDGLH